MPRLHPDQFSLSEPTFSRIRLAPDWDQCDQQSKAARLQTAFRADFLKGHPADHWSTFEAYDDSWWQSAIYTLGLPEK